MDVRMRADSKATGLLLASICYQGYKQGNAFSSYEDNVSFLAVNRFDVGCLNHSRKFPSSFVHSVYQEAKSRLKDSLLNPLQCTGNPTPISISADKYTLKHITHQMTGIRHIVLVNDILFNYSYIDHPKVIGSTGEQLAHLIVNSLTDSCGLPLYHIREYLQGCAFDGAYFNCSVPEHIATILGIDPVKMRQVSFHDYGHVLNLADKDAREATQWLLDLNANVSQILVIFRWGKIRAELEILANDLKIHMKTPIGFQLTRFSQYLSRVYGNLNDNYFLYYSKIEEMSSKSNKEAEEYKPVRNNLNSVKFVVFFISMIEISNILAIASSCVQECDRLPWYGKNILLQLMNKLKFAKEELDNGKVPSDWKDFGKQLGDLNNGVYKNVPLVLQRKQRIIITRAKKEITVAITFTEEVESHLKKVGEYVGRLEIALGKRFKDKIEVWLLQAENVFDFHRLYQPIITTQDFLEEPVIDLENLMIFENISPTLMPSIKSQYISLLHKIHDCRN